MKRREEPTQSDPATTPGGDIASADAPPLTVESLLREAIEVSQIGCAVFNDIEQVYVIASEQYTARIGMKPDEFLTTSHLYENELGHMQPGDRERYDAHYKRYLKSPRETRIEYRFNTPAGKLLYLREYMKPILDESGRLTHSIIVEQDVTELKEAESQLQQAQKMEAVGKLTGGVAHDFNNLLAVILGNLELISQNCQGDSEALELIDNAIAAAERGASFTHRLLAFSRKQELRPEPVDAIRLIQNMTDLLQTTMGESIRLKIIGGPRLWTSQVDRAQLESAVLNLAINARDAMTAGGKFCIEASNFRFDGTGSKPAGLQVGRDYVRIAASDTGTGMPDEVVERAFEPFFTTKPKGKGSGLGLSMVYGFVTQSGGHVEIDSVLGRGTTIKIYLPRDLSGEADEWAGTPAGEPPVGRGEVVLVVEDDASVRAFAVKILERLGYMTRQSETAEAALEILESYPRIDLLMTDVVLRGGMNGIELADRLEEFRPDLPVLLVSGYAPQTFGESDQLRKAISFVQKPFRIMELAQAVRSAIDSSESPFTPMGDVRQIP